MFLGMRSVLRLLWQRWRGVVLIKGRGGRLGRWSVKFGEGDDDDGQFRSMG